MLSAFWGYHVPRLVAINGVENRRRIETFRIGGRKASIPAAAPLHWGSYSAAISQVDVVAHADLIPVIDDRGAGQRHQHAIHQIDSPSLVVKQGSPASPDTEVP